MSHDHKHDENCGCEETMETIVELTDEDGNVSLFREDDTFSLDGATYAVLVPTVADDKVADAYRDADDETAYIMKVVETKDGEEYVELTDAEYDAAVAAYDALFDDDGKD